MSKQRTYPIALAQGFVPFDVLSNRILGIDNNDRVDTLHYFRNIRTHLQGHDFVVRHTRVGWDDPVASRSSQLKRQIEDILDHPDFGAEKVHIIAHSMGGLDARHMLYHSRAEGFHEKIASLTTLGTPHHGSPVADQLLRGAGGALLRLGIGKGAPDLTTKACRAFNEQADDWERTCGVRFRAYAGAQPYRCTFTPLKPAWKIIDRAERSMKGSQERGNDGLVSVQSAKWNDDYFVPPILEADHLNMLGWWDFSELWAGVLPWRLEARIKQLYLDIAEELAREFPSS